MKNNFEIKLEDTLTLKNDFPVPSFDEWKTLVEAELKGADFKKKMFTRTYDGIELKPIYTKEDLNENLIIDKYSGFENFIRGKRASGYHDNGWSIAIETNANSVKELNSIIKNDINNGANAINIIGNGLFNSAESFEIAFSEIGIYKYPIIIHSGESNFEVVNSFKLFCDKNKIKSKSLNLNLLSDPFTKFAKIGSLSKSLDKIIEEIAFGIEWSSENLGSARTLLVNGYTFHNAGATTVQELGIILSMAVEYLNLLQQKGITTDEIAKNFFVQTGISSNYFLEISKIRALRLLMKKILSAYKVKEEFQKVFIHAKTSRTNQTICDSHANILRTTTEAFSAVVGGVDSLHTNAFDELYSLHNDFSRRLARNVQIILKEESHFDEVIDPAGGSYFVEALTNQIAEASLSEFKKIQKLGGFLQALKTGYIKEEIQKIVELKTRDIKTRKSVIVGTNMYANPKENDILDKVKSSIDEEEKPSVMKLINSYRPAELFEELRVKAEKHFILFGSKSKVFLMNMGSLKQYKARADFSRAFFEVGGFDVIYNNGFNSSAQAAESFNNSDSHIFVICSTDETYPEIVPEILKLINKPAIKILAGLPKDQVEIHKQNGIDEFIYLGADAYSILKSVHEKLDTEKFN